MSTQQASESPDKKRDGTTIHISDQMHTYLNGLKEEEGIGSFDSAVRELRHRAEQYEMLKQVVQNSDASELSSVAE